MRAPAGVVLATGELPAAMGGAGIGLGAGSFRIEEATSGRGKCRASSSSTARLLFPEVAARSSSWFSAVRCEARRRTVVRFREPSASLSRQVEPSSVELREVGDELGGGPTLAAGERFQLGGERDV